MKQAEAIANLNELRSRMAMLLSMPVHPKLKEYLEPMLESLDYVLKINNEEEQQLINGLKDLKEYLKKNEASEGETFYEDKDGDGFKADMGYMESGFKEIWLWLERKLKKKEESK